MVGTAEALDQLLATIDLDEAGLVNAAIARALALKLDEAGRSDSGTIAMAISGIAKELRSVVESILEGVAERDEFVEGLFSEVGDG